MKVWNLRKYPQSDYYTLYALIKLKYCYYKLDTLMCGRVRISTWRHLWPLSIHSTILLDTDIKKKRLNSSRGAETKKET